jgi:hypothetical protein
MSKLLSISLAFYCLLFFNFGSKAQNQLNHEKGFYVDSLNRYYQQASLPLYIYVSHTADQAPTQLGKEENETENKKIDQKPIYLDGHGKHYLRHIDGLHHISENFAVYADGIAPETNSSFLLAPRYNRNGTQYYGKGLAVSLQTKDEMSGIKTLYQTTDQNNFAAYTGQVLFASEGEQNFQYYAVDNVGNAEKVHTRKFVVDLTAPETYHNVVGVAKEKIISLSTKIYLTFADKLAGVAKTYYRIDDGKWREYGANMIIPLDALTDGDHTLYYYSTDNVENKEEEKSFEFYLDRTAPIMSADVLGDRFIVGDQVYFSGRTKLKLTAVDNKAGIKKTLYSVDGGEYKEYAEPFYLPSKSGMHIIRYYALDNMENEGAGNRNVRYDEYKHNVSAVYVDLTGPTLSFQYLEPKFQKGDTIFITPQTRIKLSAFDPESGLQKITYTIDGKTDETSYQQPFTIAQYGTHRVDYFGYDNVNNRNVSSFIFVTDDKAPEIFVNFSISPNSWENAPPAADGKTNTEEKLPVYPSYATLFLAATDLQTGFDQILYTINGEKPRPYEGLIKGFEKNKVYTITIIAEDKLGNKTEKKVRFKTDKY